MVLNLSLELKLYNIIESSLEYLNTIHQHFQNNLLNKMTIFIFYTNILRKKYFLLCLIAENSKLV